MNPLEHFRKIKAFLFDVDGVFTNNEVQITDSGELLRTIHLRDSFALKIALKEGFPVGIITAGIHQGLFQRFKSLGIEFVEMGKLQKLPSLTEFIRKYHIGYHEVLYMGDDYPDMTILKKVGLACCPNDAIAEVFPIVTYISPISGGRGCVREVIQKTLQIQGKWNVAEYESN
jgi:3-deoxy-D-manno-octulosonate 8-phosphate phosphatase (KDO 8-P phosphatase)